MKGFFKKRKRLKIALLAFLLLFIITCIIANQYVKKYGYRNLWDFVTTVSHNYTKSRNARFETLELEISHADYRKLENIREKALKRGIMIDEGDGFVDATLWHRGKKIKAKVRLKGHMMDHLQENKWSFRVVTKKNDAFMGMKRFSLQHPGTRNYIYEWIYHKMMEQEGIIALRYQFIKLRVNKKSWGIYAVEEHFAQQLLEHNERIKGPLVRFSPELYWSFRINELNKVRIEQEYTKWQSSYVETYDDKTTYKDSTLLERYARAVQLMEGFRRGELVTSQVFDLKKLARFHAIIDVVGGHHSLDWSDVKYYYNAVTNKLEPVAYESFSIRNTVSLSGSNRFNSSGQTFITDLHNALFSDPVFFEMYIAELKRIASKTWLDKFLKSIDRDLQNNLAVLYKEFPYKKYSSEEYYRNIKNISHLLDAAKGFHAFVNRITADSLYLDIGGIDALPYEVLSVQLDSIQVRPPHHIIIPPRPANSYIQFKTYAFPVKIPAGLDANSELKIVYRLLGNKSEQKETIIVPVPAYNKQKVMEVTERRQPNAAGFPFVRFNQEIGEIRIVPGKHTLTENLVFPAGCKVYISAGTSFNLTNGSGIISYSPLFISGTADEPVVFTSSDLSGNGLTLITAGARSRVIYAQFEANSSKGLTLYESDADINSCNFASGANGIHIIRSASVIHHSFFTGLSGQAVEADYANVHLNESAFRQIGKDAVAAKGSSVKLSLCKFSKVKSRAVYAQANTAMKGSEIEIEYAGIGIEAKDASQVEFAKVSVAGCTLGFKASKKGDVYGPASITIKGLKEKNNRVLEEIEKKSTITIHKE